MNFVIISFCYRFMDFVIPFVIISIADVCLGPCELPQMDFFWRCLKAFSSLLFSQVSSIIDVWQGPSTPLHYHKEIN